MVIVLIAFTAFLAFAQQDTTVYGKADKGADARLDATKHPQNREAWARKKREGRPKQVWVWDFKPSENDKVPAGHWDKVNAPDS
jgi:predicted porin